MNSVFHFLIQAHLVFSWFFGVLIMAIALMLLFTEPAVAIMPFIISLLLLPPVKSWLEKRREEAKTIQNDMSKAQERSKAFLIGLMILIIVLVSWPFLSSNISEDNVVDVVKTQVVSEKQEQQSQISNAERSTEILEKVRKIPVSKYEENLTLYKELVKLNPTTQRFKDKVAFYEERILERDQQSQADTSAYSEASESKKQSWIARGQHMVKQMLKDGGSAKFRNLRFVVGKVKGGEVPMTCGEVNSKNSLGGYKGFQRFMSGGTLETTFLEEQVSDFQVVWNQLCR